MYKFIKRQSEMLLIHSASLKFISRVNACCRLYLVAIMAGVLCLGGLAGHAQGQQQPQPSPTPAAGNQQQQPSNAPAEAGGPEGDIGPIAVPKRPDEPPKKVDGLDNFSLHVNSQLVTLDVGVMTKDGVFIPGLKKDYFRVLEDNVPQTISSFTQIQAPITAVMLVEFSNNQYFYNF